MRRANEVLWIFTIGAVGYSLIEILWRNYTHWTMTLTGGVCFSIIYNITHKEIVKGLIKKCVLSAFIITIIELIVGLIVNVFLKWNVWDYSSLRFNFFGQICFIYSFMWFLLCFPLIFLCKVIKKCF